MLIKVMIIDDDGLARKGLIACMPWADYNMEVVGEASNGLSAIEFLENTEVDLALVDIDMPNMGGLQFMEAAKTQYPNLNYVVLTIHTEFEYIQQALRLGAIDYIAKSQFDKENLNSILNRISACMSQKNTSPSSTNWKHSIILHQSIYALITLEDDMASDEIIYNFLKLNELSTADRVLEVIPGIFVWTDEGARCIFPEDFSNTMLLRVTGVGKMEYGELAHLLGRYKKEQFFYDYKPVHQINEKRAYELREEPVITDDTEIERMKEHWLSLNWLQHNELFDKIKFDLKNSKIKVSKLYHIMVALENVWNKIYGSMNTKPLKIPESFSSWQEVERWLFSIYERTDLIAQSYNYSDSIVESILTVKKIVDTHYNEQLLTTEISKSVHMSRGYFSRCFHDIVGESFSDYYLHARIKKAKEYLHQTKYSVQWIANTVGYNDEKYFSKTFKKETGMVPSEYRKRNHL